MVLIAVIATGSPSSKIWYLAPSSQYCTWRHQFRDIKFAHILFPEKKNKCEKLCEKALQLSNGNLCGYTYSCNLGVISLHKSPAMATISNFKLSSSCFCLDHLNRLWHIFDSLCGLPKSILLEFSIRPSMFCQNRVFIFWQFVWTLSTKWIIELVLPKILDRNWNCSYDHIKELTYLTYWHHNFSYWCSDGLALDWRGLEIQRHMIYSIHSNIYCRISAKPYR